MKTKVEQLVDDVAALALKAAGEGHSDGYAKGWKAGYRDALRDYAWWRDGVQYVGCGTRTLAEALKKAGD